MTAPSSRILVLTYGEPETAAFLDHYRYLRRVLPNLTPLRFPFTVIAAAGGALARSRGWRKAGYKSPLEAITRSQASMISATLRGQGWPEPFEGQAAFEFRSPRLDDILDPARGPLPSRLVIVPMYLAESRFTTGISQRWFDRRAAAGGQSLPVPHYITRMDEDDRLVDLMGQFLLEHVSAAGWSASDRGSAGVLLWGHGTPLDPAHGQTGRAATERFYERLAARLAGHFGRVSLGWLNHAHGGEWTSPALGAAAQSMATAGVRRLVAFPFGFLADNSETELEGRAAIDRVPGLQVLHVPCLNDWPPFIEFLARRIQEAFAAL
jgi:ferrochelatase